MAAAKSKPQEQGTAAGAPAGSRTLPGQSSAPFRRCWDEHAKLPGSDRHRCSHYSLPVLLEIRNYLKKQKPNLFWFIFSLNKHFGSFSLRWIFWGGQTFKWFVLTVKKPNVSNCLKSKLQPNGKETDGGYGKAPEKQLQKLQFNRPWTKIRWQRIFNIRLL